MVELKGSLGAIGLPAVLQLIGDVHHSGNLDLRKQDRSGTLAFDDGRLVAAECGEHHGLQALADCVLQLADGDFTFVEGIPSLDRTLDLGGSSLSRLLDRITTGEFQSLVSGGSSTTEDSEGRGETVCPLLGFADDRSRHYSRPTALHRCFAGGSAGLVSAQEQRELCLSGQFPTCPRYRNADRAQPTVVVPPARVAQRAPHATPAAPEAAAAPEVPAAREPAAPEVPAARQPGAPAIPAAREPAAPEAPAAREPAMPPGVAARLAATSHLRMAPDAAQLGERPAQPSAPASRQQTPRRPSRGIVPVVGGALLGFVLVGLIMLVILPALRPSPASSVAFEPLGQATPGAPRALATQALPTPVSRPTLAPTPTILAAQGQPTLAQPRTTTDTPAQPKTTGASIAEPKPTAAGIAQPGTTAAGSAQPRTTAVTSAASPALLDVRFAAGPLANWLDNPPYAAWSAGAYRLHARDAARFTAVGVPLDAAVSDVVVTATFRKTGGPPGGGYGLIVRDQGPEPRDGVNQQMSAYVLETGDLGEFGVWRRDGDHWVDLVPWMRSATVRSGGSPNELSVTAVGDQLTFTVNGAEVANVTDSTLGAGGIGIFVGGDNNEAALDHFSVQLPR